MNMKLLPNMNIDLKVSYLYPFRKNYDIYCYYMALYDLTVLYLNIQNAAVIVISLITFN